jgi:ubiquitin C-terminal hydrolase
MVTDVDFPMLNLDLSPYLTTELARQDSSSSYLYDLVAVAHHSGTLNGGHYIAHVDTADLSVATSDTRPQNWMCYNDSRVTPASASSICGPSAYILFYRLKAHSS